MEISSFVPLIQKVTGRDFLLQTSDLQILPEHEYQVYRILPHTGRKVSFYWKTPKSEEKMLKSFITAFTNKYREPNPAHYDGKYYGSKKWEDMKPEAREFAYGNHASNMYSKNQLLEQVQKNFHSEDMGDVLLRHGFYPTEYGIGIFALWETQGVVSAIQKMNQYLRKQGIPYSNEYSDARWVLRFKLGLDKKTHTHILQSWL